MATTAQHRMRVRAKQEAEELRRRREEAKYHDPLRNTVMQRLGYFDRATVFGRPPLRDELDRE